MTTLFLTVNGFSSAAGDNGRPDDVSFDEAFFARVGFPCRSGCTIREDGSLFELQGNDFDCDDALIEVPILEAMLGRTLSDEMVGSSFKIALGVSEPFDPEEEVNR